MKSILITEISGFVGGHFTQSLMNEEPDFIIYGVSGTKPAGISFTFRIRLLMQLHIINAIWETLAIYDSLIKEEKKLNG